MTMRMHSSLSATMDLGQCLDSHLLKPDPFCLHSTVGTLPVNLPIPLALNHVNPAPTHTSTAPTTSAVS